MQIAIVGRPNVGKSALFNRLLRRSAALVYNTPDSHVRGLCIIRVTVMCMACACFEC